MGFMLIFGLAQGFQPFAGYNYGAGRYDRLKEGFRITLIYASLLGAVFTIVFQLFGRDIIRMFIADQETIEAGAAMLRAFSFAVPFIGVQMTMMITFSL